MRASVGDGECSGLEDSLLDERSMVSSSEEEGEEEEGESVGDAGEVDGLAGLGVVDE